MRALVLALVMVVAPARLLPAQVPNQQLADSMVAARQKNAALLAERNWNCRTEVTQNGSMKDLRIDLVVLSPAGTFERTLLNDEAGKLPRGFLRRAVAQGQQQQAEQAAQALEGLLDQYVLPSPGKIGAFLAEGRVQPITTPDGTTMLEISGTDLVVPDDRVTLLVDGRTLMPANMQVTTSWNGDTVTMNGTFKTFPGDVNLLQYASIAVPSKSLDVTIHNYDCVLAN